VDYLSGGTGADNLEGGRATDELSGGPNNDTINALGGGLDNVSCGLGTNDRTIADTNDGVSGDCERVTTR
jgi:hypothetical protein